MTKKILLLISVLLVSFASCKKSDNESQSSAQEQRVEEKRLLREESTEIDLDFLKECINRAEMNWMDKTSAQKYDLGHISRNMQSSVFSLIDSLQINPNIQALLILESEGDDYFRLILQTRNLQSNKYIDSRYLCHYKVGEEILDFKSTLDIGYRTISYFEQNSEPAGAGDLEYKTKIGEDGRFEDFPNEKYSKAEIEIFGCLYLGLQGKLKTGEVWTLIDFENKTVDAVDARYSHLDFTGSIVTEMYLRREESEYGNYSIAFKGNSSKQITFLPLVKEEDVEEYDTNEFWDKFRQLVEGDVYFGKRSFKITEVKSFIHNSQPFHLMTLTAKDEYDQPETLLIGQSPEGKLTILTYTCLWDMALFKKGEDLMLYTSDNACEGYTQGQVYVYRIGTDFEQIFKGEHSCPE